MNFCEQLTSRFLLLPTDEGAWQPVSAASGWNRSWCTCRRLVITCAFLFLPNTRHSARWFLQPVSLHVQSHSAALRTFVSNRVLNTQDYYPYRCCKNGAHFLPAWHSIFRVSFGGLDPPLIPGCDAAAHRSLRGGCVKCGGQILHPLGYYNHWHFNFIISYSGEVAMC